MATSITTPHPTYYAERNRRFAALLDAITSTTLRAVSAHTGEHFDIHLEESDALALFHAMHRVYAFDFGVDFDYNAIR